MMKKTFFFLLTLLTCTAIFSQTGIIRGNIIDNETGETLIGANVLLLGTSFGTVTDIDGDFLFENIPVGEYTLNISYISYLNQKIDNVVVSESKITTIDFKLVEDVVALNEVTIVATEIRNSEAALLSIQKKSAGVIDGISASQISKSGDGDVASAIKRVNGVTIEGGKYVYVRGLGERYSKTAVNGAELPGVDPDRNAVQMDLFPTALINNLVVYKTFTPNLPASFTGGYINIETKDFPDKFTLNFSTGFGYNKNANLNKNFLTYDGSKNDKLGFYDGSRDAPVVGEVPDFGAATNDKEIAAELANDTKAFSNQMDFKREVQFLNTSYSFGVGNQHKVFGNSLGYFGAITYSRSLDAYYDGEIGRYFLNREGDSKLIRELYYKDEKSTDDVLVGALANIGYKIGTNNKIGATFLQNQSTSVETRYQSKGEKQRVDPDATINSRKLGYQARTSRTLQLKGDHVLNQKRGVKLSWLTSQSNSEHLEPDLRYFTIVEKFGEQLIDVTLSDAPIRFFRSMEEQSRDSKVNVEVPFTFIGTSKSKLSFGVSHLTRDRVFLEQRYTFNNQVKAFGGDIEAYLNDVWEYEDGSGGAGVYLRNRYTPENNYEAQQQVSAAYVMTELALTEELTALVGARIETTDIYLETYSKNAPVGELNNKDVLPSLSLNYKFSERTKLRASATKTLARPTFRELAPFASYDFAGDFVVIGNANLERTTINNFDFRWEMYPNYGELVSVSLFYKDFTNPIEKKFNPLAGNPEINYRNVDKAEVLGVEFEARKKLGTIAPVLAPFNAGGNLTLVQSKVLIDEIELQEIRITNSEAKEDRQMFGQSPFVVNLFLGYENGPSDIESNLTYAINGPKLAFVADGGTPDVFEQGRHSLNWNVSKGFKSGLGLKFSIKNILDAPTEFTYSYQDTEYIYSSFKRGQSYSVSLKYSL
ncbi:MAG: TonB-dependent receptor [Sphingobacteriales bacterium]|jgi:TonB-dependent receptor